MWKLEKSALEPAGHVNARSSGLYLGMFPKSSLYAELFERGRKEGIIAEVCSMPFRLHNILVFCVTASSDDLSYSV
jgi:hypothetical protein